MTLSNPQTGIPKFAVDMLNPQRHVDSRLTFSRAGNATMFDATGTLVWAPANMFLNSATLATQSVTVVVGQSYTMSAYGTGSVALSDGASGTWTGTGVGDRVPLAFTATTTTATFTVTGSVTSAQLEPTSYNSPQPYIPTTSAAYYGPRFDYDPSSLALSGFLHEESRQNILIASEYLSNTTYWARTFADPALTAETASPLGTNSAWKLLATSTGNQQIQQVVTITSGASISASAYAKEGNKNEISIIHFKDGSNYVVVKFNLDDGTPTLVEDIGDAYSNPVLTSSYIGNGWYRCTVSVSTSGITSTEVWIRFAATAFNDYVYLYGPQLEAGSFATSYIPTYGATATRAIDINYTNSPSWFNPALPYTVLVEFEAPQKGSAYRYGVGIDKGTTSVADVLALGVDLDNKPFVGANIASTTYIAALGTAVAVGGLCRVACVVKAGANLASANGATLAAGDFGSQTVANDLSRICIGDRTAADRTLGSAIKSVKFWNYAMTQTQINILSKV